MAPEMLLQSLQQLPGENHSIPIMSPSAAAAADMIVLERQIARLQWQQQQLQQQSQQQPTYFADTIFSDTSLLIPPPYSPPQPIHILSPSTVSLHTTSLCGEQGMISHDFSSGSAGALPDVTHDYPFLCNLSPGEGALGSGGGAISRTFSCQPLVGNDESRGILSPPASQLEHPLTTNGGAAGTALFTDGARERSKKRKPSTERAITYKVVEDDRLKKMIKVENTETLVEPKVESPSSTVITANNCKDDNNREASSSASKEKKKAPEPSPKIDYIHVRARRGQATDSHSLAERVRREKISERMKFLQDLVPGCNKNTGKAGMLDEIINYVQSLQRQVEFLSMNLAAATPALEFNFDALITEEMSTLAGGCGIPAQMGLPTDLLGLSFLQFNPLQQQAMASVAAAAAAAAAAECCSLPVPMVSSCSPVQEGLRGITGAAPLSGPPETCSFPDCCNILAHPTPPPTTSGWEAELQRFYATTVEELEEGRPAASVAVDARGCSISDGLSSSSRQTFCGNL